MNNPEIDEYGNKYWRNPNGISHREGGPAVEWNDGTLYWFKNGKWHREDGPAIEYPDGEKFWYMNGKKHREDGPAIEYNNGYKEWHFHGKRIHCSSQEEFERIIKLRMFW